MVTLDNIEDFISDYQELWWEINDSGSGLPCMDIGFMVDDPDYYGCDFSGNNKVYMLFFTGTSNFFPAIVGIDDGVPIDECPIYIFDLACDDMMSAPVGNFRCYITLLVENYLRGLLLVAPKLNIF